MALVAVSMVWKLLMVLAIVHRFFDRSELY